MIGETIHRHISAIILYPSLVSKSSDKGNENNTAAFLHDLWGVGEERTPSIANGLLLLSHAVTPDAATPPLVLPSYVEPIVSCISHSATSIHHLLQGSCSPQNWTIVLFLLAQITASRLCFLILSCQPSIPLGTLQVFGTLSSYGA